MIFQSSNSSLNSNDWQKVRYLPDVGGNCPKCNSRKYERDNCPTNQRVCDAFAKWKQRWNKQQKSGADRNNNYNQNKNKFGRSRTPQGRFGNNYNNNNNNNNNNRRQHIRFMDERKNDEMKQDNNNNNKNKIQSEQYHANNNNNNNRNIE